MFRLIREAKLTYVVWILLTDDVMSFLTISLSSILEMAQICPVFYFF